MGEDLVRDEVVRNRCEQLLSDYALTNHNLTVDEIFHPVKMQLLWEDVGVRTAVLDHILHERVERNPGFYVDGESRPESAAKGGKRFKWNPYELQLKTDPEECLVSLGGECILTVEEYNLAALENAVYADCDKEKAQARILWFALRKVYYKTTVPDTEYQESPEYWMTALNHRVGRFYSAFDQMGGQESAPNEIIKRRMKDEIADNTEVFVAIKPEKSGQGRLSTASTRVKMDVLPAAIRGVMQKGPYTESSIEIERPYGIVTVLGYSNEFVEQNEYAKRGKEFAKAVLIGQVFGTPEAVDILAAQYARKNGALQAVDTAEVFCLTSTPVDNQALPIDSAELRRQGKAIVTTDLPYRVQRSISLDRLSNPEQMIRCEMPYATFTLSRRGTIRKGRTLTTEESESEISDKLAANRLIAAQIPITPSVLLSENMIFHSGRHGVMMRKALKEKKDAAGLFTATKELRRSGVSAFSKDFVLSDDARANEHVAAIMSVEKNMADWIEGLSPSKWAEERIVSLTCNEE